MFGSKKIIKDFCNFFGKWIYMNEWMGVIFNLVLKWCRGWMLCNSDKSMYFWIDRKEFEK